MKAATSHDLIVIGGGSAGHAAAKTAAGLGLKAALIESAATLGGLCILRGCMPSKALIETANRMRDIRRAEEFGIRVGEPRLDPAALRRRTEDLVEEFREYREDGMKSGRYELLRGVGRFSGPQELDFTGADGATRRLTAKAFVIATGSSPAVPGIPGLEGTPYWTSDEVVRLPFLPRHLAVLGAGAVGMECAHLFEGLGSRVTILTRGSVLGRADPELAALIEEESRERGIRILKGTELEKVEHRENTFRLQLRGQTEVLEADALLIATGRSPATSELGLEAAGVAAEKGRILIDDRCVTSVPHIFAAGDCASPVPVVHVAVIQGEVAARNAVRLVRDGVREAPAEWDRRSAMLAWFTEPQCVEIGLSERAAAEDGIAVLTGKQDYADHGKGMIAGCRRGFVKVVAEAKTGRLIGACGCGPLVAETGHLLQEAIRLGVDARDYLDLPHYHPTFAEAWHRAVEDVAAKLPS